MKPKIITEVKSFCVDYLPVNIESFRDWLDNQIDKIPEEFRKNSSISIERDCFDADAPIKIKINMMRYESEHSLAKFRRIAMNQPRKSLQITQNSYLIINEFSKSF